MSETAVKLIGLACMVASVFLVLFGIYVPPAGSIASPALVIAGLLMLLVGGVLYAARRSDP